MCSAYLLKYFSNQIDIIYVRRTVDEIERGNKQILRLPEGAEKGRIAGGRRTLEASVILGIAEEADREKFGKSEIKEKQEELLEQCAKYEGIWKMKYLNVQTASR